MSQIQCQHFSITFVFSLVKKKKTLAILLGALYMTQCCCHLPTSLCLRFLCQQGPLKTTNTKHTREKVGTKQSENAANKRVIFHANAYFFPYTSSSDLTKKP